MIPLFFAKIKDGKIRFYDQMNFNGYINSLNDQEVRVSVGKVKKQRSNQENRYYWGVVIKMLGNEFGYYDEEMHDALKMMFLMDGGRIIPTLKSTASLSTKEFEEYMTRIREWAAQELNFYIPEPNEVDIEQEWVE